MRTGIFFEICVSKNGKHVFATDSMIRSYNDSQIKDMVLLFKERFPEKEYKIEITSWKCGSNQVPEDLKELLSKE